MSQHYFNTQHQGRPIRVLLGWDRPLQGFFMVIERMDAKDDESDYLYSNLTDEDLPVSQPQEIAPYLQRLEEFGIVIPQKMLPEVLSDREQNVGNKVVHHE